MIYAEFFRKNGNFCGFEVKGHAGLAESGSDIACASVSSAVQMSANTITDIFKYKAEVSVGENTVLLKTAVCDEILQKLYDSLLMQLELLSQEFNGTINIEFTEV